MSSEVVVIFDLDGTLVDSQSLALSATRSTLEQHGYHDVEVTVGDYELGGRLSTPRRLAWHATGNEDHPCGPNLAMSFEKIVATKVNVETVPMFSGALECLNYLRGKNISVALLSNASSAYVNSVVDCHQLRDIFKVAYGVEDVPMAKPAPDGLNKIMTDLHNPAHGGIYIGDSPTDGTATSAANLHGIGVSWGNSSQKDLESHFNEVVSSFDALQAAVDKFVEAKMLSEEKVDGSIYEAKEKAEPKRRVSWQSDVIDNENMHKFRTDDEYWDGR